MYILDMYIYISIYQYKLNLEIDEYDGSLTSSFRSSGSGLKTAEGESEVAWCQLFSLQV